MVKATDIGALIERYLSEKKLACLEALYMWSKGISSDTIASVLRNRHENEGDVAYPTIIGDLSGLKITSTSDSTEDTREPVSRIIEDIFTAKCVDIVFDRIRENLKVISPEGKKVLVPLLRSGLFLKGEINGEELRLVYRTLYNETPNEFSLNIAIKHLEKIGLLYRERTYRDEIKIKVLSYVYALLPEIEAKLEKSEG
jgi:hypothetical protein